MHTPKTATVFTIVIGDGAGIADKMEVDADYDGRLLLQMRSSKVFSRIFHLTLTANFRCIIQK